MPNALGPYKSHRNDWHWIGGEAKSNFEVTCVCFLPFANKAAVAN